MIPDALPTAVYRFYDVADRLLYVGVTDEPKTRWKWHAKHAEWWPLARRRTVVWHDRRWDAEQEEAQAIRTESPIHNRAGTPGYRTAPGTDLSVLAGHRYAGAAEVGAALGVSRQRVTQLTARPDWPKPYDELAMGKVWRKKDVEAWIAKHRPPAKAAAAHDSSPPSS